MADCGIRTVERGGMIELWYFDTYLTLVPEGMEIDRAIDLAIGCFSAGYIAGMRWERHRQEYRERQETA